MTFKHVIGKSTLKYGFTIPKRRRHGIEVPAKGERRRITLVYADNQRAAVWQLFDTEA